MKKKILAFFMLIALVSTFLFGCNLFDTNNEKDLQRVIAEVGDANYKDEIKKYELVNYYISAYSQASQQGSSVDIKSLLDQMIYRRIEVQEAINYLLIEFYKNTEIAEYIKTNGFTYYEITGRSGSYSKENIDTEKEWENYAYKRVTINVKADMEIKDVLKPEGELKTSQLLMMLLRVYYDSPVNVINKLKEIKGKSDLEGFEIYYQALKDSEVFSDYLTISAFNAVWESEKSNLDQLENQLRKDRGLDAIEEEETETETKRAVPAKDKEDTFVLPNANEEINSEDKEDLRNEALKKYKNQIKKNFFGMTYDEFFEKQLVSELEEKIVNLHKELYIKNYPIKNAEAEEQFKAEFIKQFKAIKDSEEQSFNLSLTDYKTKLKSLGDDTFILYNPDAGIYGYVKHILLGLDTDLNKGLQRELNVLKTREMTRAVYNRERDKIFSNIRIKDLREGLEVGPSSGIFEGYPDFTNDIFTMKESDGDKYFYNKFKAEFGAVDKGNDIYQYDKAKFTADDKEKAMLDKFEQYIFMYNTDPGMFNNTVDYLLTEMPSMNKVETGDFAAEFAEVSRDLIQKAHENYKLTSNKEVGYYKLIATDYGYHLIICSDIITAGGEDLTNYDEIIGRIKAGTETPADKKTAIYKLYMIIRNTQGQVKFDEELTNIKNKYYRVGKVELFESRYKDLLNI